MDDQFLEELRRSLNHLYDPDYLRHSPLVKKLGLGESYDRVTRFQRLIEEAIQDLRPKAGKEGGKMPLQFYRYLVSRHLQQFSQNEVANQLSISQTQLYRIQRKALMALAAHLWEKYHLEEEQGNAETGQKTGRVVSGELDWLSSSSSERVADLSIVLRDVLDLLHPKTANLKLSYRAPSGLVLVATHPIALRQVLLSLLNTAARLADEGELVIDVDQRARELELKLSFSILPSPDNLTGRFQAIQELTQIAGGRFTYNIISGILAVSLHFPAMEGIPILAIDDSQDHLDLLKRSLANSHYQLNSTRDAQKAMDLAVAVGARAILLDVMMPNIDGWGVIQQIRNHPILFKVPVIVCSIVPVEDLAEALSADAFLRKPFSLERLLAELDRLTDPRAIGSG